MGAFWVVMPKGVFAQYYTTGKIEELNDSSCDCVTEFIISETYKRRRAFRDTIQMNEYDEEGALVAEHFYSDKPRSIYYSREESLLNHIYYTSVALDTLSVNIEWENGMVSLIDTRSPQSSLLQRFSYSQKGFVKVEDYVSHDRSSTSRTEYHDVDEGKSIVTTNNEDTVFVLILTKIDSISTLETEIDNGSERHTLVKRLGSGCVEYYEKHKGVFELRYYDCIDETTGIETIRDYHEGKLQQTIVISTVDDSFVKSYFNPKGKLTKKVYSVKVR